MTAIRTDRIDEGAYLVRGTPDLTEEEAREAVVQHILRDLHNGGEEPEVRAAVAHYRCEIGLYRKYPCRCGEDHQWHMDTANERGPGVFTGAHLD